MDFFGNSTRYPRRSIGPETGVVAKATKKNINLVGIDISATSVKVVQLSQAQNRYRVEHYAIEPLQPGAVDNDTIHDTQVVGKVVEQALKKAGIKAKGTGAAISVPHSAVYTITIQVPGTLKDSDDDIEAQVELEAGNHIPYPRDDVRLDFAVMGPAKREDGENFLEVLVAAARTEVAKSLQEAIEVADLTVEVMDVEPLVIENAYGVVAEQLQIDPTELVALVDIGATTISLSVMQNGLGIFRRDQPFGGGSLERELRQRMGTSQEEALAALRHGDLPSNFEESVLEPYRDTQVQNINRLLQYFYSGTEHSSVHRILLTGGGANTKGLPEVIDERLGIPTHVANPLAGMSLGSGLKGADLTADAPALFLATGLALRSFA